MSVRTPALSRSVFLGSTAALAAVLLLSSIRTFRELEEQRIVFLRHRVALLAGRLESPLLSDKTESLLEILGEEEPNLLDVQVISRSAIADESRLESIWNGRQLFLTESLRTPHGEIFRAYVPFHSAGGLRIARIDLNTAAADFLMVHARHNLLAAALAGIALILLSAYALWSMRRAAAFQVRQLEMEHLANIGKMSAVLAHEIRNPLGTIKGFAQLALERADRSNRDLLTPILAESQRLELLVRDLLAYGRPPAPEIKLVEWSQIAAPLRQHALHLIGDRPIRFSQCDAALRWRTDPLLLQEALLNLVRNAIEAIPDQSSGEVRVEWKTGGSLGLEIFVTDTGLGLSAAASRLFEPFFTTKSLGTGLGLPVTRNLVASLGGELDLQPAAGGGAQAILRFPRVQVEGAAPACENHG